MPNIIWFSSLGVKRREGTKESMILKGVFIHLYSYPTYTHTNTDTHEDVCIFVLHLNGDIRQFDLQILL